MINYLPSSLDGRSPPAIFADNANSVFLGEKRSTKDNGDGLFSFTVAARPADLPDDLKFAPVRTSFKLAVAVVTDAGPLIETTKAQRLPISDLGNGLVTLAFAVLPNSLSSNILYAKRGTQVRMSAHPDLTDHVDHAGYAPEQRRKTMQRIVLLCKENEFREWLSKHHDPAGLIHMAGGSPDLAEQASAEAVLRRIGAHSRAEILRNAIVCERAELIIRLWRETRFDPIPISLGIAA
ncbi:hypothetical protein IC232_03815 [Microvirga sp. BT688]|uniref:hypothetical protein n=1 Tax=Microvirga sp. TaxID=1873136 RepID=UPI0016875CBA|nr:hypothetical protein [Microvirga sp.]MBD2745818.1 hypothetical protein [Microvirga sp.]